MVCLLTWSALLLVHLNAINLILTVWMEKMRVLWWQTCSSFQYFCISSRRQHKHKITAVIIYNTITINYSIFSYRASSALSTLPGLWSAFSCYVWPCVSCWWSSIPGWFCSLPRMWSKRVLCLKLLFIQMLETSLQERRYKETIWPWWWQCSRSF